MSDIQENPLRAEKRKKLHALREKGINPYPYSYERTANTADIFAQFDPALQAGDKKPESTFKVAGRIMTLRSMGKAVFFNLMDQSGPLQIYVKTEELPEKQKEAFLLTDLGDIVGVVGIGIQADGYCVCTGCNRCAPERDTVGAAGDGRCAER